MSPIPGEGGAGCPARENRVAAVVLTLLLVVAASSLLFLADRGFDVTDEGYYLTTAQFPEESPSSVSTFFFYTAPLFRLVQGDVARFRIVGILLTLASGIACACGVARALTMFPSLPAVPFPALASFLGLGSLLYYYLYLFAPSYNSLTASFATISVGLVCLTLSSSGERIRRGFLVLAGMCLGLLFFVKPPAALALLALYGAVFLFWPERPFRAALSCGGWLLGGMGIWILIHFAMIQSAPVWWKKWLRGFELIRIMDANYGASQLLRYGVELRGFAARAAADFLPLYPILLGGAGWAEWARRAGRERGMAPSLLILAAFLWAAWKSHALGFDRGGCMAADRLIEGYLAWFFLLAWLVILGAWLRRGEASKWGGARWKRAGLLGMMLGLAPFAAAMGTGNAISVNFLFTLAPWFGLLFLLVASVAALHASRMILVAGLVILGAFACAQIVSSGASPYRLAAPILRQAVPTEVGVPPTRLLLDPETSRFFMDMTAMARRNGFVPGDDILAFFNMPGLVFALGGKSPGAPWYVGGLQGSQAYVDACLARVPVERLRKAFVIEGDHDGAGQRPDLGKLGIRFPQDYIRCGESVWPLTREKFTLWAPRSTGG